MFRKLGDAVAVSALGGILTLAATPLPAGAAMIGTGEAMQAEAQQQTLAQLQELVASEEVRAKLRAFGVDPEAAERRVASLSPEELSALQQRFDELPAGADALEVLGIVFLVLLVLELLGVTNVFSGV